MSREIAITNLNFRTSIDDIYRAFHRYGDMTECRMVLNERLESKGYAFVSYKLDRSANEAINEMNEFMMDGPRIIVTWSKGREEGLPKINREQSFFDQRNTSRPQREDRSHESSGSHDGHRKMKRRSHRREEKE